MSDVNWFSFASCFNRLPAWISNLQRSRTVPLWRSTHTICLPEYSSWPCKLRIEKHVDCVWRMVDFDHRLCPMAEWAGRWCSMGRLDRGRWHRIWLLWWIHRQLDDVFPGLYHLYAEVSLTMAICFSRNSCQCRYWEVQVELGEAVQGWIYWTWKVWPFACLS